MTYKTHSRAQSALVWSTRPDIGMRISALPYEEPSSSRFTDLLHHHCQQKQREVSDR